ncbi:MAG: hypothetical protein U0610_15800 [bacterium]
MHAQRTRAALLALGAAVLTLATACGGGGGGGGPAQPSELGEWTIGTLDMSGGDSFQYQAAALRFTDTPHQVAFSAQHSDTVYSWISDYTKTDSSIVANDVPEVSDPTDLVTLDLTLVSQTSLVGTVTESYPGDGGTITVVGAIDATR